MQGGILFPKIRIGLAEFFESHSAGSQVGRYTAMYGGIGLCYTYAYNYTLSLYLKNESHHRFSYDMSKQTYEGPMPMQVQSVSFIMTAPSGCMVYRLSLAK